MQNGIFEVFQTNAKLHTQKRTKKYVESLTFPVFSGLCRHTVSHIAQLFKEKGSDCWWELPTETLLPAEVLKKVSKLCYRFIPKLACACVFFGRS